MAEFGKLNFSVALDPTSGFPVDARVHFSSLEDAQAAAATAGPIGNTTSKYFYGLKLCVTTATISKWYTIQPDKTLLEDGAGGSGVGLPSVTEEDDGKVLSVVNGKWQAAELPKYSGSYEVTPAADAQTLETAKKLMTGDVTVGAIPYSEVSNNSGGTTVTIA